MTTTYRDILINACSTLGFPSKTKTVSYAPQKTESDSAVDIVLYAQPANGHCPDREITLYAEPVDGDPCPCIPAGQMDRGLELYWPEIPPHPQDSEISHRPYPALRFGSANSCKLVGWTVDAVSNSRDTITMGFPPDGGPVVEPPECAPPKENLYNIQTNKIIPGSKLELTYYLDCASPGNIIRAGTNWWRNCCIAGGKIIALQGEKNDLNLKYTIEIFGQQVTVLPIDWSDEPLEIGDWALVLAVGGNCAEIGNKAELTPDGDFFYMVPYLKVGNFVSNVATEEIDFILTDNRSLLALRVIPVTIIEINDDNATADVETDIWGRVDDVVIHYHCQSRTDILGGHKAFRADDEVVMAIASIAHEAHDPAPAMPPSLRWIIGFADGQRRACIPNYYVFYLRAYLIEAPFPTVSWASHIMVWDAGEAECLKIRPDSTAVWGAVMVWDLNANAMATDIPDGNGGFLDFPCYGHKANGDEILDDFYDLTDNINVAMAMRGIGDAFGNETHYQGYGDGHTEYDIDACGITEKTTYDGTDDYGGLCQYYAWNQAQYANDWRKISNPADKEDSWEYIGNGDISGTMCVNMRYESETFNQWQLSEAAGYCHGPIEGHRIEHTERTRLQCVYGDLYDYSFSRRWKECVKDGSGNLIHYWDLEGSPRFVKLKKKTSDYISNDITSKNIYTQTLHGVSGNDILQIWVSKAGCYDGLSNVVQQPNPLNFDPQYCNQPYPVPRGTYYSKDRDDHTIPPYGPGYFRAQNVDGDYEEESMVQYIGIGINYEFCDRPRSHDDVQVFCATKAYTDPDDFDVNGQTKNTALADAIGFLFEHFQDIAAEEELGIQFMPQFFMGHYRPHND